MKKLVYFTTCLFAFFLQPLQNTVSAFSGENTQERHRTDSRKDRSFADLESLNFTVEEAKDWTELFIRQSGWFGADGIFSIPLDGKEHHPTGKRSTTLLIFSDTMIGEIVGGSLKPGASMVNNSVAYLQGSNPENDQISFHWAQNESGKPVSTFVPASPSAEKGDYYWLGDGFVNREKNGTIYIFAYRMRNLDDQKEWSFKEMGLNLIAIPSGSKMPFKEQRQLETPFHFEDGSLGAGIFVNTKKAGAPNPDGFVYVYGVRGKEKKLLIARVLPRDFEDFGQWKFWDGETWNTDMNKAAFVCSGVSNELSVSVLPDGRYALIFQLNGMSSFVGLRLGKTPFGPFGPVIKIWECREPQQKNIFTYNAKAHPCLSPPGELLISYNVNAFNFLNEIANSPNLYRPRFIRLKIKP